jgi:hypothetical protein
VTEKAWSLRDSLLEAHDRLNVKSSPRSIDRLVAVAVGKMMRDDPRSRFELADDLSAYLGESVSEHMLNAYSSPAREQHAIPAHRLLALAQLTGRRDLIDSLLREFSCRVLTQPDFRTFEIGALVEDRSAIDAALNRKLDREK